MSSGILTDSDLEYVDRILIDCRELVGPFVKFEDLDVEMNDEVALRVAYRIGEARGVTEGRGQDLFDAHANLRSQIARDWIEVARTPSGRIRTRQIAWLLLALIAWTIAMACVLVGPAVILIVMNLGAQ
ncbi:MAG TPA: hypothetical protein VIL81_04905 [Candidatus Limnocylindrales bacterium]|jgi:hypothetical protein